MGGAQPAQNVGSNLATMPKHPHSFGAPKVAIAQSHGAKNSASTAAITNQSQKSGGFFSRPTSRFNGGTTAPIAPIQKEEFLKQ